MKLTLKLFLVVCLFSSVTFADGDMPGGGFAGDMPGGGKTCTQNCVVGNEPTTEPTDGNLNQSPSEDSVLTFIQEYLISIFV